MATPTSRRRRSEVHRWRAVDWWQGIYRCLTCRTTRVARMTTVARGQPQERCVHYVTPDGTVSTTAPACWAYVAPQPCADSSMLPGSAMDCSAIPSTASMQ